MDEKVQAILAKHEGEFILAYRNHVKKVREEMEEIRKKATSSKNSTSGHYEKIESLEKQLILFREESLSLFEKITTHEQELDKARIRIADLELEKSFNQKTIKNILKRNKYLEGICLDAKSKKSGPPSELATQQAARTSSVARGYFQPSQ